MRGGRVTHKLDLGTMDAAGLLRSRSGKWSQGIVMRLYGLKTLYAPFKHPTSGATAGGLLSPAHGVWIGELERYPNQRTLFQ